MGMIWFIKQINSLEQPQYCRQTYILLNFRLDRRLFTKFKTATAKKVFCVTTLQIGTVMKRLLSQNCF
jgi:hypothetical protein